MKAIIRHNVCAFCARHKVVLDTLTDWRPLDANYTWSHQFFGDVVEGITDGIVAWTVHADGRTCFVHLDMCKATAIPRAPLRMPKAKTPRVPRPTPQQRFTMSIDALLDSIYPDLPQAQDTVLF